MPKAVERVPLEERHDRKLLAFTTRLTVTADERAVDPLKQATQDADEIVSRAAKWALQALHKALLDRKQSGV